MLQTVLLILAKKERRFLQITAGKGSLKQPRYLPPFDQPHEKDVAIRQRTVKTCQRTAKIWGNYAEYTHESALVADMLLTRTVARLAHRYEGSKWMKKLFGRQTVRN